MHLSLEHTYVLDGVAALDVTGVAAVAAEDSGRGDRKEGESEEGEGSSAGKHCERVWGIG